VPEDKKSESPLSALSLVVSARPAPSAPSIAPEAFDKAANPILVAAERLRHRRRKRVNAPVQSAAPAPVADKGDHKVGDAKQAEREVKAGLSFAEEMEATLAGSMKDNNTRDFIVNLTEEDRMQISYDEAEGRVAELM